MKNSYVIFVKTPARINPNTLVKHARGVTWLEENGCGQNDKVINVAQCYKNIC